MALRAERADGAPERLVAVACLTHKAVLARVAALWAPGALPNRWADAVVGLAVGHYLKWKEPPGADTPALFAQWRTGPPVPDRDTAEAVAAFLESLSDDYSALAARVNPEYVLATAVGLMQRVRLVETSRRLADLLDANDLDGAAAEIAGFRPVELGAAAWLDVADGASVSALVAATRAARGKPLIEYPGALGAFLGRALERDSFVSFLGYKKGQKSFFLQDLAWRGVEQGRRVAYFEAGDMSAGQVVVDRLGALAAGRPVEGSLEVPYKVPVSVDPPSGRGGGDGEEGEEGNAGRNWSASVTYEEEWHRKTLTDDQITAAIARGAQGPGGLRLACHPNSTLSVRGIESQLEVWARDGWVPDVVVIDYADILAPLDRRLEGLDRINETWKALRALSQKLNCLVATATQARRDSPGKAHMTQEDVSDETRKLAHVTAMWGINRNRTDIRRGVWRLNWIAGRTTTFAVDDFVWTAGNLAYARPAMVSAF